MAITEKYASAAGSGAHDGSSQANEWSWSEMITAINALAAGGAAGMRVNYRGDRSSTSVEAFNRGGTSTSPFILRGYKTTPGDGYLGRSNEGTGPLIATNLPVITYTSTGRTGQAAWTIFESLSFTANVNNGTINSGGNCFYRNCIVNNSNAGSSAAGILWQTNNVIVLDSDVSLSGGSGGNAAIAAATFGYIVGCRVTAPGSRGIHITFAGAIQVLGCTVHGCSIGIEHTTNQWNGMIGNCTVVKNTSDGIKMVTGLTSPTSIWGCLITDNGGYGFNANSTTNAVIMFANRLDRNTSGNISSGNDHIDSTSYGHNTTSTLQADEYEDYANNDFRLKATSPAVGNGLFGRDVGSSQYMAADSTGRAMFFGGLT